MIKVTDRQILEELQVIQSQLARIEAKLDEVIRRWRDMLDSQAALRDTMGHRRTQPGNITGADLNLPDLHDRILSIKRRADTEIEK